MNLRFSSGFVPPLGPEDLVFPALGPKDLAILTRVRAMALVLRAAPLPELEGIALGLRVNPDDQLFCISTCSWTTCLFLARQAGWHDLLEAPNLLDARFAAAATFQDRLAQAEFPQPCPLALGGVLRHIQAETDLPAEVAVDLRQAGWEPCGWARAAQPILSEPPSAHELLEALVAVERAGGWGHGPLGGLARAAAATWTKGRPS